MFSEKWNEVRNNRRRFGKFTNTLKLTLLINQWIKEKKSQRN